MKYKPSHTYELVPTTTIVEPAPTKLPPNQISIKSKAERIKEFKQLLDEKIITQEEFDKEKKKILDEDK